MGKIGKGMLRKLEWLARHEFVSLIALQKNLHLFKTPDKGNGTYRTMHAILDVDTTNVAVTSTKKNGKNIQKTEQSDSHIPVTAWTSCMDADQMHEQLP